MNCRIKTKTGTVFFKRCHFPLTVKCDPVKRVNKLLFKKIFQIKKNIYMSLECRGVNRVRPISF